MDSERTFGILVAQIRDTVPDLDTQTIARGDSMADLGVDSMERSEIILATLEEIGLKVPMVDMHGPSNIGELADLLAAKSGG